jgi:hypothetical protein
MSDTVLVSIGCQKGGTSWLAAYLDGHPEARLGLTKEMHVLDTHFLPAFAAWNDDRIAENARLIAALSSDDPAERARIAELEAKNAVHAECQSLSGDLDAYARYFRARLDEDAGLRIACDITPSYAALDAPHWQKVREAFARQGLRPKLLFVMRDPVERVHSAFRMIVRRKERDAPILQRSPVARLRRAARAGLADARARFGAALGNVSPRTSRFLAFATDETNLRRSRFDLTMAAIEVVFPPEDIHYAFFEELFTDATMTGITDFLGIAFRAPDYGRRVNASPSRAEVPAAEAAYLRRTLEPAYAACAARFGDERIAALWRHARTGTPPLPGPRPEPQSSRSSASR